jgi:hypothetical protein
LEEKQSGLRGYGFQVFSGLPDYTTKLSRWV